MAVLELVPCCPCVWVSTFVHFLQEIVKLLFIILNMYLFDMYECLACMYVHVPCVHSACGRVKRASDLLELE